MAQLDLPFDKSRHPLFREVAPHIVDAFFKHHAENPKIYERFKTYARQLRQAGREYHSAQAIIERVRWDSMVSSATEQFKINNNHPSCYARMLMIEDPSFIGFFRRRHTPGTVPIEN